MRWLSVNTQICTSSKEESKKSGTQKTLTVGKFEQKKVWVPSAQVISHDDRRYYWYILYWCVWQWHSSPRWSGIRLERDEEKRKKIKQRRLLSLTRWIRLDRKSVYKCQTCQMLNSLWRSWGQAPNIFSQFTRTKIVIYDSTKGHFFSLLTLLTLKHTRTRATYGPEKVWLENRVLVNFMQRSSSSGILIIAHNSNFFTWSQLPWERLEIEKFSSFFFEEKSWCRKQVFYSPFTSLYV